MSGTFEFADVGLREDSEYHRLVQRCDGIARVCFDDGEYLITADETSLDLYLVLKGAFVVETHSEPADNRPPEPLAAVEAPDASSPAFVGEMAYLDAGLRTASVRSSGVTYALRMRPEHLNVIMEEFPVFTRILCNRFAERLRRTTEALRDDRELFALHERQQLKGPGEIVFRAGDPAETLYQLLEGALVRETAEREEPIDAEDLFLGFIEPGAYLRDNSYRVTVKAATETTILAIPKESKFALIRNMPELAVKCLKEC